MSLSDRLSTLSRIQQGFWFKVILSTVLAVLGVAAITTYVVRQAAERGDVVRVEIPEGAETEETPKSPEEARDLAERRARLTAAESAARAINQIAAARHDPTALAVGVAIAVGVLIGMVWLGLGISGLVIVLVICGVLLPLGLYGHREGIGWLAGSAKFSGAVLVLGLAFLVLMELLKLLLSGAWPVMAVARNLVSEAVRMKVSLVFIVLLILGLAALPGLLDAQTPLRYRVQSFLQYATSGTFWLIAILTLFLSVGTVAFEQRDRVIWQTMTKPVAPWQYLLGKWLGVVAVSGVLLVVSSAGIFLFTEHLRQQPALGELAPFEVSPQTGPSEDRTVLESQVLTARLPVRPELPRITEEGFKAELDERAARARASDPSWVNTPAARRKLLQEFSEEMRSAKLTIEPAGREIYEFSGLRRAREQALPLTLRYRVEIGANDPRETATITFFFENAPPVVQTVPLGLTMTLPISTGSVRTDGTLAFAVVNGDVSKQAFDPEWAKNQTMSFPPDGIEIYYPVGSYRQNFLRVVLVLWMKLAFLACVGVVSATFLSFAVSSMVAFGVFLIAESAGFLMQSLEYYASTDQKGNIDLVAVIVRAVAVPVAHGFQFYAGLKPTSRLVSGELLGWGTVGMAAAILGAITSVLFITGVAVFRRRELATYSGQ